MAASNEFAISAARSEKPELEMELQSHIDNYKQAMESLRDAKKTYEHAVRSYESQIFELSTIIRERKTALDTLKLERDSVAAQLSGLEKLFEERKQIQNQIVQDMAVREEQFLAEMKSLTEKNQSLTRDLMLKKESLDEKTRACDLLQQQLAKAKEASAMHRVDQAAFETERLKFQDTFALFNQEIEQKNGQIESLEVLVSKKSSEVQAILNERIHSMNAEQNDLKKELTTTQRESSTQVQKLESENQQLRGENAQFTERLKHLEAVCARAKNELSSLMEAQKASSELEQRNVELINEVSRLQAIFKKSESEKQRATLETKDLWAKFLTAESAQRSFNDLSNQEYEKLKE